MTIFVISSRLIQVLARGYKPINTKHLLVLLVSFSLTAIADEHLYQTVGGYGCSACHGKYANGAGNVGGNIRGASLKQLNQALENEPTMQLLAPALNAQQRVSLSDYLQALNEMTLIEWNLAEGAKPSQVHLLPNTSHQLVIKNDTFSELLLDVSLLGEPQALKIAPLDTQAVSFVTPKQVVTLNALNNQLTLTNKEYEN
ncbi:MULTISPECIES: hypothetical protein [unclassified Agarivorans]|uniref:hypothetical protein n=1 Tax=unclassified Agarivorans TaxID=2636026 RepID=UPI0026E3ED95|nr:MULTISPECIES: hypothetical protein [unclassified Agarivorans]MDO6686337.1 hypothetical protein [Agarivorans sp. 3_MG-2023]MDO6713639.1 hypothetical protein [Agarivorans sp. 2_MG-2023]